MPPNSVGKAGSGVPDRNCKDQHPQSRWWGWVDYGELHNHGVPVGNCRKQALPWHLAPVRFGQMTLINPAQTGNLEIVFRLMARRWFRS